MESKRLVYLDYFRAICALIIIAYWHIGDYVFVGSSFMSMGFNLTVMALAGFTFISGLLNGGSKKTLVAFYKGRLKRFYIPFVISYFLLVSIGLNTYSTSNFLLTITGFCCFSDYQPFTLWYISMLLLFYIFTPLLVKYNYGGGRILLSSLLFIFFSIFVYYLDGDHRSIVYFLFYLFGANLKLDSLQKIKLPTWGLPFFFFFVFFTFSIDEHIIGKPYMFILGVVGIVSILTISYKLERVHTIVKILGKIAYASMFAYLFHRFFYYHLHIILEMIPDILEMPIMIVLTFTISFYLQKYYDTMIVKLVD